MIQKLFGPRGSTAVAPFRPQHDSTSSWGSSVDRRHYRLDIVQQVSRPPALS
jgi:hypothetical protein